MNIVLNMKCQKCITVEVKVYEAFRKFYPVGKYDLSKLVEQVMRQMVDRKVVEVEKQRNAARKV